jgi:tetratricopeptide (TPR) repeat protein
MGFTLSMPCRADHWRRGLTQPNDVPAMMKEVHPDDAVAIGVSREPGRGYWRIDGMAEMMTTDVRAIMDRTPFDASAVADLREVLGRDPSRYRTLRDAVANIRERDRKDQKPETYLRLGVGEVLLGRYGSGLEHLKRASEAGMAFFFQGLAFENLQKYDDAAKAFAQAAKLGYDPKNSELVPCAEPAKRRRPRRSLAACRS